MVPSSDLRDIPRSVDLSWLDDLPPEAEIIIHAELPKLFDSLQKLITRLLDNNAGKIAALRAECQRDIDAKQRQSRAAFDKVIDRVDRDISSISDLVNLGNIGLKGKVDTLSSYLRGAISRDTKKVTSALTDTINAKQLDIRTRMVDQEKRVKSWVTGSETSVRNGITQHHTKITASTGKGFKAVTTAVEKAGTRVIRALQESASVVPEAIGTEPTVVSTAVLALNTTLGSLLQSSIKFVDETFNKLVSATTKYGSDYVTGNLAELAAIGLVTKSLSDIPTSIGGFKDALITEMGRTGEGIAGGPETSDKTLNDGALSILALADFCGDYTDPITNFDIVDKLWANISFEGGPVNWMSTWAMLNNTISIMSSIAVEPISYHVRYQYPCIIPPIADQIDMDYKKISPSSVTKSESQAHGYSGARYDLLKKASARKLSIEPLLRAWLRDDITESDLDTRFTELHLESDSIDTLKKLAYYIPPPSDLITMLVREVFNAETVARFGQLEDYPEEFTPLAKKLGISEYWAKNYWGAHWRLPSAIQGFKMLHRGIINEEDLTLLLKSLDIMPFWRDRIIKLSYRPYSRVDVRRMHAVGTLDEGAVKRSYLDLGYDDDKAQKMTDFTLSYNADAPEDVDLNIGGLTRSTILRFYRAGTLDRKAALGFLVHSGINVLLSNLYLDHEDAQEELQSRDDHIELLWAAIQRGDITINQAMVEAGSDGFSAGERGKIRTEIENRMSLQVKTPSVTDMAEWAIAGDISLEKYKDVATAQGWDELYLRAYLIHSVKEEERDTIRSWIDGQWGTL